MLVCAALLGPAPVLAQGEGTNSGPSVLVGGGLGFLAPPAIVVEAHTGAGWRTQSNLVAAVVSASWATQHAMVGDWVADHGRVAFGVLGGHWFSPTWHLDAFAIGGPSVRRFEFPTFGTSETGFMWSAGIGGGWKALALHLEYVNTPDTITVTLPEGGEGTWPFPGGFQVVLTGTFDAFRIGGPSP